MVRWWCKHDKPFKPKCIILLPPVLPRLTAIHATLQSLLLITLLSGIPMGYFSYISIHREDVKVAYSHRYIGLHLDDRLEWTKKHKGPLQEGSELAVLSVETMILQLLQQDADQSVVSSAIFYMAVYWGCWLKAGVPYKLNKTFKKACSGTEGGNELDSVRVR